MSVKDMQVVTRYSGGYNFYKLYFNGELTDPYGEKNSYKEIQKPSDFEDFLSYTWDSDDISDSSISDDESNEVVDKKLKPTNNQNCASLSDLDSDSGNSACSAFINLNLKYRKYE